MTVRMNPYLVMDGNAREAIRFYEQALDAEVLGIKSFGEMPDDHQSTLSEENKQRVAHALLKVGETDLMISDIFPGQPLRKGDQLTICITCSDAKTAKKIFEALQQGGQVNMPLQETFWSPAYGSLTDKFGVSFQITTEG